MSSSSPIPLTLDGSSNNISTSQSMVNTKIREGAGFFAAPTVTMIQRIGTVSATKHFTFRQGPGAGMKLGAFQGMAKFGSFRKRKIWILSGVVHPGLKDSRVHLFSNAFLEVHFAEICVRFGVTDLGTSQMQ